MTGEEMRIDRVAFEQLKTFGDYENVSVRAEAAVAEGEYADDALERLREFVGERLAALIDLQERPKESQAKLEDLEWRVRDKERELNSLQERATALRDLLKRHGVEPDDIADLPF